MRQSNIDPVEHARMIVRECLAQEQAHRPNCESKRRRITVDPASIVVAFYAVLGAVAAAWLFMNL